MSKKEKALEEIREKIALETKEKTALYEDCFDEVSTNVDHKTIEAIANELNQLTKILAPLHFFEMREKIKQFCKENLESESAINLVELIPEINNLPDNYIAKNILAKKEFRVEFKNKLESKLINKNGVVSISFDDLSFSHTEEENYFAAHVQIYNNGITKSVINDISNGAGKLFGRFGLQQDEFSTSLKNYISKNEKDEILVLNQDHSTNQVNAHPELFDNKIALPDSFEKGISPGNLFVTYQAETDKIYLVNRDSEPIRIVNLGVESESTRSYFYPYLSAFTGPRVAIRPLLEIINICMLESKNSIHILPRIELGEHLILQRKSWHYPVDQIPKMEKGETSANYFLRIQIWVSEMKLPKKVFIKRQSEWYGEKDEQTKSDLHKPQYIDFSKIDFIALFNKQLCEVAKYLQITEVLPEFDNNANYKVQEYAIEWFG